MSDPSHHQQRNPAEEEDVEAQVVGVEGSNNGASGNNDDEVMAEAVMADPQSTEEDDETSTPAPSEDAAAGMMNDTAEQDSATMDASETNKSDDNSGSMKETENSSQEQQDASGKGSESLAEEGEEAKQDTAQEDSNMEGVEAAEEDEEEDDDDDDDGNDNSSAGKPEVVTYSTRGRASQETDNALDRLALAGDLLANNNNNNANATNKDLQSLHSSPPASSMRESFLSDSLTEEERRTRTRYLPSVEGMHALRKQEVKGDLSLARTVSTSSSSSTDRLVKSKRGGSKLRSSGEDGFGEGRGRSEGELSEEDRMSDALGGGGLRSNNNNAVTVEIADIDLTLPSTAFVPPPAESTSTSGSGKQYRPSPREVEAVTAFNPPRPPESVGAKKKHRMLRWERRPADIEVDLSNYRKTVQRTREEWKNALAELERIETVDNHLRRHFLLHIKCLNEEMVRLSDELAVVQQECVDLADLPASRTRTRGAFKGSAVMRDVLHSLHSKGVELEAKGLNLSAAAGVAQEPGKAVHGIGGVSAVSFKDWDRSTQIEQGKLAEAWIVPGDRVDTPYGEGTVVAVYAPGSLNVKEPPHPDLLMAGNKGKPAVAADAASVEASPKEDAMEVDKPASDSPPKADSQTAKPPVTSAAAAAGKKKAAPKTKKKAAATETKTESLENLLAPRIAVRLPFGVAFFNLESVASKEDPSRYSDKRLAERWKGIVETAKAVGGAVDVAAMADYGTKDADDDAAGEQMDVDDTDSGKGDGSSGVGVKRRLVPFGSSMLPTAVGRGALLYKANMAELDQGAVQAFYNSGGVLGLRDNIGVSKDVRELEDQRQKRLELKSKVLQLRNQLYRQRRIKILNEKTYAATQERASRVESLVAEMRTDLKSLKGRLDLEISDLGVSEEQAENILTSFYMSLDSQHLGEASPPKRQRRHSRLDEDSDEDMEDPLTDTVQEDATSADLDAAQLLAGAASSVAPAAENAEAVAAPDAL